MGGGMTRDEIIGMAVEVGLMDKVDCSGDYFIRADAFGDEIVLFAWLVEAAERERLNKKIAALEADIDHFFKLSGQYLERANKAEEAVAAERERCAKIVEENYNGVAAACCADQIRGMK